MFIEIRETTMPSHSCNKFHSFSKCNVAFMCDYDLYINIQFKLVIWIIMKFIMSVRKIFDTTTTLNQWQSHPFGSSPSISNSKAANSITSTIFIPRTNDAMFIKIFTIVKSISFYKFLSIFTLLFYLLIIIICHISLMWKFLCL